MRIYIKKLNEYKDGDTTSEIVRKIVSVFAKSEGRYFADEYLHTDDYKIQLESLLKNQLGNIVMRKAKNMIYIYINKSEIYLCKFNNRYNDYYQLEKIFYNDDANSIPKDRVTGFYRFQTAVSKTVWTSDIDFYN